MISVHLTLAERLAEWLTRERWETVLVCYPGQRWVAVGVALATILFVNALWEAIQ